MNTSILPVALLAVAVACAVAEDPPKPSVKLDLKQKRGLSTAVLYRHEGPPPWPHGNCISLGKWHVINMHSENISAFERNFGVHELEVRPVDDAGVVVIDARVPKEWLRVRPCKHCNSLQERLAWRVRYKEHFEVLPETAKLIGSVWELAERQDTGVRDLIAEQNHANIVARVLPGERIQFLETAVACSKADGKPVGKRWWEPGLQDEKVMLIVYDLDEESGHFVAIRFRVDKVDDELVLAGEEWIRKDGIGTGYKPLGERRKARVSYRRVAKPNPEEPPPSP